MGLQLNCTTRLRWYNLGWSEIAKYKKKIWSSFYTNFLWKNVERNEKRQKIETNFFVVAKLLAPYLHEYFWIWKKNSNVHDFKIPPKNTGLNHRFTNQNKNETNFNYNNFVLFAKKLASLNFLFEKKNIFF